MATMHPQLSHPSSDPTKVTRHAVEAVERVRRLMLARLGEDLRVDDLARSALFSRCHFTRVFQQVTGLSPARYLAALRVAEAERLLRTTDLKVIDITYRVGYSSVGSFSARFSRQVGVSPTAYRRRARAQRRVTT